MIYRYHHPSWLSKFGAIVGKVRRSIFSRWMSFRSTEAVFTEIYRRNLWGGEPGSICSGGGSDAGPMVDAYVNMIGRHAQQLDFKKCTFVDLGCGDMRVGEQLLPWCAHYIGVDVVEYVVDRHRINFEACGHAEFIHRNIADDELPDGDVCFIRQVLQHMSNFQISKVISKISKYRYVYISEHLPGKGAEWIANIDKPHGPGIGLDKGSGVDITLPPFNIPTSQVALVLEVTGNDPSGPLDPGVIRTVLYTPGGVPPAL